MRFEIFNYKSVTSTNDTAINLIKEKKKECGFVHADNQTKGRGTQGIEWISLNGNLFGSLFFHLKKDHPTFSEFSIINPIIISEVIKLFCKGGNITLKFPNDILVNGKKICGILQELITFGDRKFLIIGVGINVIKSPIIKNKYEATNILAESNKKQKTEEIIKMIILSYEKFFLNINSFNYLEFKKKADLMAIKE